MLNQCPEQFVGDELRDAIYLAGLCESSNLLPIQGGLLDQSAWFCSLFNHLSAAEANIRAAQLKRI